jgi:hypothetical protein
VLRQLARLTRALPAAGDGALAVAVYTDATGDLVVAKESGYEGVACVDDAARLLDVLCEVWSRTGDADVARWARGVLAFVRWMQGDDGRWVNFVYDWGGARNETGPTSSTGENFWHARAMLGLSAAWRAFDDEGAAAALQEGLEHAIDRDAPSDVRALHVMLGLRLLRAGRADLTLSVRRWADEIAACRIEGILMNNPDETGEPHLWAHVQEGVLADAGVALGDRALVDVARESAAALLTPAVRTGFARASVTPYDVACTVRSLDRLAAADPGGDWADQARVARAWFSRDRGGVRVYDPTSGRVADGVDEGRVSANSGAEANIVAAEVLPDDALRAVDGAVALLPGGAGR